MARLDGSDAARETLMITGARTFLERLQDAGVALYLASGSDYVYVVEEAAALGVAGFVGDEVYGARDAGPNDAPPMTKGDVIARILADHDLHGEELLVVGDGPVEIRQGKARGAVALGIAADEAARQGLDPRKRERLLNAGADLIVTDFTHHDELVALLVGE
jgi:phosphoglycolate phosphatase-like HAD superfamily hydrolase